MFKRLRFALFGMALVALLAMGSWAQGIFATLTGVVTDPSGGLVPNANVTLRDAASGSDRNTVTDGQGTTPLLQFRSALTN